MQLWVLNIYFWFRLFLNIYHGIFLGMPNMVTCCSKIFLSLISPLIQSLKWRVKVSLKQKKKLSLITKKKYTYSFKKIISGPGRWQLFVKICWPIAFNSLFHTFVLLSQNPQPHLHRAWRHFLTVLNHTALRWYPIINQNYMIKLYFYTI